MYQAVTRDIEVIVAPRYLAERSSPDNGYFFWAYSIEINNRGTDTVQLKTRHWKITDANGRLQEVRGAGVARLSLGIVAGEPLYVLRLEPETNRVVVGPESGLYQDKLWASRVNYTLGNPPTGQVAVSVKIRYKSAETGATLHPHPEGALVCFDQPQRAITPGQAVVFYLGDVLLGGGIIEGAIPPEMDQAAASLLGGED